MQEIQSNPASHWIYSKGGKYSVEDKYAIMKSHTNTDSHSFNFNVRYTHVGCVYAKVIKVKNVNKY